MRSKWLLFSLAPVLVAAAVILLIATHWPFTRAAALKALQEEAEGPVTIGDFHQIFFPHPGCVAHAVVIRHGSNPADPPLVTVEAIAVEGSYLRLLTFSHTLKEIRTQGMHIHVPADRSGSGAVKSGPQNSSSSSSPIAMDRFVADNTLLDFASKDPQAKPFVIQVHHVQLSPGSAQKAMSFDTSLAIPQPAGEISAHGNFGPWNKAEPYQTPVSGSYTFRQANLAVFSGIAGILASNGHFEGAIDHIHVADQIDIPDFEIRDAHHPVHLRTNFEAIVNGQTGDVTLNSVESNYLSTAVFSHGAVASPQPGEPKRLTLELAIKQGRIQDLLRLVDSGPPGLTGVTSLRFHIELPPGKEVFLQKLRLTGDFGIGDARFTNVSTQQGLDRISRNASDGTDNPADVISDLRGHVSVAGGVATLSHITFHVPGAAAEMNGTYQLLTHRVDLEGTVRLDENLSQATTGIKSFLLKPLDPLFRKRKHLSVIPIKITGVSGHTSIELRM